MKINFFFLSFCIFFIFNYSSVMANEELKYEIIKSNEIYEIRKYSDRLAVEAITTNQNSSFRKLFNYISGNNKTSEKIEMTTPVTRIKKNGNITMQFYLPARFDENNVPDPSNLDIKIVNIKGGHYAVLRYSGRSSDNNFIKHKDILQNELISNSILIISPPIRATYNSPFTLPVFRRNEAIFKINY